MFQCDSVENVACFPVRESEFDDGKFGEQKVHIASHGILGVDAGVGATAGSIMER